MPQKHEVTVWFGAMPETNGKMNWTAMLVRKDAAGMEAHIDGITLMRSEYKDRVRYEADRMRYLIGELDEEPFILDYDENLIDNPQFPQMTPEQDKIEGLESDLEEAVRVAYERGAAGWTKHNYPDLYKKFTEKG